MMTEENVCQLISVEEFQQNIRKDVNLPQNLDNILLQRYLNVYDKKDVKKSLELLKYNLKTRISGPHLFFNRDPLCSDTQIAAKTALFCPLPKLLDDQYRVTVISLISYDVNQFDYVQIAKMALMMFDARFTEYDEPVAAKIASGECFIIDSKGASIRHFLNVVKNVSTVRIYMKYIQEAAPFNIKKVHFINCSYILDKMFALIKPLLNKELLEVIYFHTQGLESLYEHIPKAILPAELGGEVGSMIEIYENFQKFVVSKRDYLINDENWKMHGSGSSNQSTSCGLIS